MLLIKDIFLEKEPGVFFMNESSAVKVFPIYMLNLIRPY